MGRKAPGGGPKQRTINRRTFAYARAAGMTQADAYRAAGGQGCTQSSAASLGARLERDPRVRAMIDKHRERMSEQTAEQIQAAWSKYVNAVSSWPDDPTSTKFDIRNGMELIGKAGGKFVTKVEVEHRRLEFRDFSRPRVIDAQLASPPALPEPAPLPTQAFEVGAIDAAVAKPAPMPEEP